MAKGKPNSTAKTQSDRPQAAETKGQNSSKPKTNDAPQAKASNTSQPKTNSNSQPKANSTSQPKTNETSQSKTHNASKPTTNDTSKPKINEASKPKTNSTSRSNQAKTEEKQSFLDRLPGIIDMMTFNLPPRIKTLPLNYFANGTKATMFFYLLSLMWYFKNYSLGAFVYLGLHTCYGLMWNIKTLAFPDRSHQNTMSLGSLPLLFTVLTGYYYLGYFMMSGQGIQNPTPERVCIAISVFCLGSVIMMTTDAQKYFTLKYRKGLINDGMLSRNRNTNYLGEMMLYGALAYINGTEKSYVPWIILLSVWLGVFTLTMFVKELSLRKKEGYKEYKERSWLVLFKPFRSDVLSLLFYAALGAGAYYVYSEGGTTPLLKRLHPHLKKFIDNGIGLVWK